MVGWGGWGGGSRGGVLWRMDRWVMSVWRGMCGGEVEVGGEWENGGGKKGC